MRLGRTAVRSGEKVEADVVGEYFFGAPYPDAEVKITVSRTRFYVPWYLDADYSWYYSDAEYRNTERETVQETTCTLNKQGECTFSFETAGKSEDFTYVIEATARDPKGKTITGVSRLSVTRAAFRLEVAQKSLVVTPGAKQQLEVKAIDYEGNPVETSVKLVVKADQVGADGKAETVEVLDETFKTEKDGIARIEVDPSKGGYYQVVASAKDDQGNEVTAESFLFAAQDGTGIPNAPTDLVLVTDKRSYFAGDTALVLVLAPAPEANVLFSVEGGDLYSAEVLKTSHHAALAKVKIGERQTPNFFVSASCVLGGQLYVRHRSVIVPPREKLLKVEVAPDRPKAQPGEDVTFTVHVTDYQGNAVSGAEVALGIVDEAIYAISPEIAVPIQSFFHHRKRNDVRTTDSISFRFFGSSKGLTMADLGPSPFAFGTLKPQEDDRKVFKDTAGWFGALTTDAEGKATAKVTLPDNLTAWRATARVATKETAVGSGTGTVVARKPVVVRVAMPGRVSEGDTGAGSLLVQNLTGGGATFDSTLELSTADGDAKIETTFADASKLKGLAVGNGQLARIPFTYAAAGSGKVKIVARTKSAEHQDGLNATVTVTPWATPRTVTKNGRTSSETKIAKHTIELPKGVASAKLTVETYPSTLGAVRRSLPYLVGFPYGCTEQTMSRFGPLLDAKAAFERLSIPMGDLEKQMPAMIAAGLSRLNTLQHNDGGWGWWEKDQSDVWMTAWVVAGLGQAKSLGAEITADRIDGGINRLTQMLGRGNVDAPKRAFALYALSRHGVSKPAMLQKLIGEASGNGLPPISIAYAALAATEDEDKEKLKQLLIDAASKDADGRMSWCDADYVRPDDHPVECTAVALSALVHLGADVDTIGAAEAWLMGRFEDDRFGSTRQTALVVRALSQAASASAKEAVEITVRVNGKEIGKQTVDTADPTKPLAFAAPEEVGGNVTVEVEQSGGATTFHTVALRGLERAETFAPDSAGGLTIRRSFFALEGTSGNYKMGSSVESFSEGDALLVRLQVESKKKLEHVIVEDPRPAGLEPILRDSGVQVKKVRLKPRGVHRAHKAGRSAFFVGNLKSGKTELYYLARATTAGSYRTPPATVEAMYLPGKHHARSSSTKVSVKKK